MGFRRILFLIIFVFCHESLAAVDWQSHFYISSRANYVESTTQQARTFGIAPAVALDIKINEKLNFYSRASALLETGSHKGTLLDEFKPDQQIILNYAYFNYLPWHQAQIKLGAIPMKDWAPDILVADTRFLGAGFIQALSLWNEAKLSLFGLGAIPSNQELTNRLGTVSEGTPSYTQLGLSLELPGDLLAIKTKVFAWNYNDIGGNVAFQSGFMGNQTNGIGSANTRLSYEFKGLAASGSAMSNFSNWYLELAGDYLFNDGAPDNRNQALRARTTIGTGAHDLSLVWYEIESDAAIGYYNNAFLGHTNRDGLALEYKYHHSKAENIGIAFVRAKTLQANLLQADQDAITAWWSLSLK